MIPCKGYRAGNPSIGYDFDCEYENAGEITCDECICNGGNMSPQTGKKFRGNIQPYIDDFFNRMKYKHDDFEQKNID